MFHEKSMLSMFLVLFLVLILFFVSLSCISAANYTVGGNSFGDIQDVVNNASSNDIILLGNKIYSGSGD